MTETAAPAWRRMSAVAQGDAIARGEIDPRALCAHYLDRIAAAEGAEAIYVRSARARRGGGGVDAPASPRFLR